MPTKPPVATVSPERIRRTASRADTTLPLSETFSDAAMGWRAMLMSCLLRGRAQKLPNKVPSAITIASAISGNTTVFMAMKP